MEAERPTILFVCVSNAGKSQMAEALMRAHVGDAAVIHSGGTNPKGELNVDSAASVARVGASMAGTTPKGIDAEVLRSADRVIVLGRDARVEPVAGMKASVERWETDEPSLRGIEGDERMDLIRDDIQSRIETLAAELGLARRPSVLFVCVHNAGRSQMAAAYTHHLSNGRIEVRSAGSAPAEAINPAAREAMLEEGIDIAAQRPKLSRLRRSPGPTSSSPWAAATRAPSIPESGTRTGSSTTQRDWAWPPFVRSATKSGAESATCSNRSVSRFNPFPLIERGAP